VYDFNPDRDYYYKPLSQSIEPEHSKLAKRKEWTTLFGYAAQIPHPDAVKMLNYIFGEITKLMGDEFSNFQESMLNEEQQIENTQGGGGMQASADAMQMSNQNNIPMSGAELGTRGIANIGTL
jgi:hypothetical protein